MPIDYKEYGREYLVKSHILRGYGRCALCGAKNHAPHPQTGSKVVLTVHHLDCDKKNHDLFNLAPLCQGCHLAQHRDSQSLEQVQWCDMQTGYHKWIDMLLQFMTYVVPQFHKYIKP